jgi:uncharacterized protein
MIANTKSIYRPIAIGIVSAAVLVGSFLLGSAQSGSASSGSGGGNHSAAYVLTSSGAGGKITVTGTGTVTGRPNQLVLSMGVQTSASSVSTALAKANAATRRVIHALKSGGVRAADIQTSGLSISPNYSGNSQVPVGYGVSEQLTATLGNLAKAGSQIQAAVDAGGDATTVDGVSLNLTDTSTLLAQARTSAVRDAQAKAAQFARALGRSLGGVISISDQSSQIPYPVPLFAGTPAAKAAGSVPVSPGKQQVSVQITVVYAIG